MADSVARRVAIMGTTCLWEAALISSWATKFRGSDMATYSSSFTSFTGTTQYFLAMDRGTNFASSKGMDTAVRSTKSTPSCICSASMRCCSVIIPLSISTSPRRSRVCFCIERAFCSSSCPITPAAISRSPKRIYAMIEILHLSELRNNYHFQTNNKQ